VIYAKPRHEPTIKPQEAFPKENIYQVGGGGCQQMSWRQNKAGNYIYNNSLLVITNCNAGWI
jgi:hypothetical protein